MGKTVRSAKGIEIDFDILKIKQQLGNIPKPTIVSAREDFVDQKLKRRVKQQMAKLSNNPIIEEPIIEEPIIEEPIIEEPIISTKKK